MTARDPSDFASPACSLHELEALGVDPAYLGYLNRADLIELLNAALAAAGGDNPQAATLIAAELARLGETIAPPEAKPDRTDIVNHLNAAQNRIADPRLRASVGQARALLEGRPAA